MRFRVACTWHSPKPVPVIGVSRVGDHPVLRIGLSWSL